MLLCSDITADCCIGPSGYAFCAMMSEAAQISHLTAITTIRASRVLSCILVCIGCHIPLHGCNCGSQRHSGLQHCLNGRAGHCGGSYPALRLQSGTSIIAMPPCWLSGVLARSVPTSCCCPLLRKVVLCSLFHADNLFSVWSWDAGGQPCCFTLSGAYQL